MKKNIVFLVCVLFFCFNSLLSQTNKNRLANTENNPDIYNLSEEIIKQRIEMFLLKNYQENHKKIVVEYDQNIVSIPVNRVDWEIKVDSKYSKIKNGSNLVEVTVFSKKEIYKKFMVTAKILTFDDIVIASRMLEKGEKLTEEMVSLESMETTNFKRDYFTSLDEIIDLQTKKIINKEKPVFTNMVELPDIILRGDIVKIVVKIKNMEVTATGKALQNGKRGEIIKVQNQSTGKKLTGEIINEKTILVELQ